jgi:hypothetical protein
VFFSEISFFEDDFSEKSSFPTKLLISLRELARYRSGGGSLSEHTEGFDPLRMPARASGFGMEPARRFAQ